MLYFIPAWYKQNMWCENEQQWYMRRLKSEFDETIKQITLFHRNVDRPYRILVLGYSPNFRHFLHRQGMYRSKYWSCFDAIAQVRRKKVAVLSYHDIKWPKGLEFVYSPFSIIALQGDVKYAQVEFGEDGNPISIDMFEYKNDGHVVVNPTCPDYDVVPDAKSGKAGEPVEMRFTKAEYDSLEAVIEEVFASYVNLTRQNDNFFVAMHPLHIRVAEHVLKGKTERPLLPPALRAASRFPHAVRLFHSPDQRSCCSRCTVQSKICFISGLQSMCLRGKGLLLHFLKTDLISRRHHWQRIF